MNAIDLHNRCAVVTGGAKGIGRAIAERLAASGARVSLWDAGADALDQATMDGGFHGLCLDVTDAAAVEAATVETTRVLGRIDILVNNAGITGPNQTLWTYPVEEWRRVIDVDLTGVFLCCRAVVPHMLTGGYGRIVNVASIAGKEGNPNAGAYSAAKAGVIALTKSLGKELVGKGADITVNCVTPAAVRTDIFAQMSEEHVAYMLSKIPMGRFGTADEVAALVAWLASAECSFSTGAVFDVSGGRAVY